LVGLETAQFISNIERGVCAIPIHILKIMVNEYRIDQKEVLSYLSELNMMYYKTTLFDSKSTSKLKRA
jgi:hypothetical protein